jgi:2-polyprenyl-6-methoxyphenol hydroxylase-like FAD-dependent oxidoreductase
MAKNELGHVVIVGAGPGNLILARILQLKGVEVKVYEREESINARSQGGTLDLHVESGQYALPMAHLFKKFEKLCRSEGQDTRVMDKTGTIHYEEVSSDRNYDRPEIDRDDIRQLLLESLKENTIIQGHNLRTIQSFNNGQHKLVFDNGLTDTADLVVGSGWSMVSFLSKFSSQLSEMSILLQVTYSSSFIKCKTRILRCDDGRSSIF